LGKENLQSDDPHACQPLGRYSHADSGISQPYRPIGRYGKRDLATIRASNVTSMSRPNGATIDRVTYLSVTNNSAQVVKNKGPCWR